MLRRLINVQATAAFAKIRLVVGVVREHAKQQEGTAWDGACVQSCRAAVPDVYSTSCGSNTYNIRHK